MCRQMARGRARPQLISSSESPKWSTNQRALSLDRYTRARTMSSAMDSFALLIGANERSRMDALVSGEWLLLRLQCAE